MVSSFPTLLRHSFPEYKSFHIKEENEEGEEEEAEKRRRKSRERRRTRRRSKNGENLLTKLILFCLEKISASSIKKEVEIDVMLR